MNWFDSSAMDPHLRVKRVTTLSLALVVWGSIWDSSRKKPDQMQRWSNIGGLAWLQKMANSDFISPITMGNGGFHMQLQVPPDSSCLSLHSLSFSITPPTLISSTAMCSCSYSTLKHYSISPSQGYLCISCKAIFFI